MRRINIGWKLIDEDHPWNNKGGRLRDYSNPKVTVSQIYSCSRDVNLDLETVKDLLLAYLQFAFEIFS